MNVWNAARITVCVLLFAFCFYGIVVTFLSDDTHFQITNTTKEKKCFVKKKVEITHFPERGIVKEEEVDDNLDTFRNGIKNNVVDSNRLLPFSKCHSNDKNADCLAIDVFVFDENSHARLLDPKDGQRYMLPNSRLIPRKRGKKIGYCGFGHLLYNQTTKQWSCRCMRPEFFGGKTCDSIQERLIKEYNCTEVASKDDPSNKDISTFNPLIEGICSKCASPDAQTPVMDADIPRCTPLLGAVTS